MWLDGFNIGNKLWKTYSFRELDFNHDPKDAVDLSYSRRFYEETENKEMESIKPRKLPLKFLNFPVGFCSSSSDMVFQVTGKWQSLLLSARPPIIQFHVNIFGTGPYSFWYSACTESIYAAKIRP